MAEGRTALLEHEAKALLRRHGAPVSEDACAGTPDEAVGLAASWAAKWCSRSFLRTSCTRATPAVGG
jgi:acyl-CoA synthetase (NDP forming)